MEDTAAIPNQTDYKVLGEEEDSEFKDAVETHEPVKNENTEPVNGTSTDKPIDLAELDKDVPEESKSEEAVQEVTPEYDVCPLSNI